MQDLRFRANNLRKDAKLTARSKVVICSHELCFQPAKEVKERRAIIVHVLFRAVSTRAKVGGSQ